MKKIRFTIVICILLCAALACVLVGCNQNKLSRPDNLKLDGPTLTLSWRGNDSASYYVVNISGNDMNEDKNTRSTSISLSNLALPAGDYQLKVKACGNGKEIKDSPWSKSIEFSQDTDSGLSFKFVNNNKEVEVIGIGRASGDVVIPDTYRGVPITRIGERAFSGKSKLKSIVFGKNVKSVGASAFYNCTFLESVSFSNALVSIGDSAFKSCKLLAGKIEIPQNVTLIDKGAFAYCPLITEVKLNAKLETLSDLAFELCTGLTKVEIPNSVNAVGASAFFGCKNITSVRLGSGVKTLGEYAFGSCEALTSVVLNNGLVTIDKYAFGNCKSLTDIAIPDSVTTIGLGAFYQSEKLANVTFGKGIKRVGTSAFTNTAIWTASPTNEVHLCNWFLGCKDNKVEQVKIADGTVGLANASLSAFEKLSIVGLPNSVKIIGDGVFAGSKITQIAIGSGVEEIGAQAFYKCELLNTVILGSASSGKLQESSLKIINENAFMGCLDLKEIEIPDTVELISSYAFNGSGLYNNSSNGVVYAGKWIVGCDPKRASGPIVIDNDVVGISNYAFYQCDKITSVTIADSVKTIGRSAFYQCTGLETVKLPSTLEVIQDYTFYGCSQLVLPKLPNTLKSIGRSAFYKCALKNANGEDTDNDVLTIPNSVETIGDYAFFGCGYKIGDLLGIVVQNCGIDSVRIGNGVTHIGANAFNSVVTLKSVIFGSGVRTVGDKAFYQCEALSSVIFNRGLSKIGARAFYGCKGLTTVNIPDGLFEIGDYAFYRCSGLTAVNFNKNLESIGNYAFYGCAAIENIVLPEGLAYLGKQAFRSCTQLKSVVLLSSLTNIEMHAFYGCGALTIYTQDNQAQAGWNEYFNSSFRPVIRGCTVVDGYVYSVTKAADTVINLNASNSLSAPYRAGYTFAGWSTAEGASTAEYALDDIVSVKDGTKLYTVWTQI